MAYDESVKCPDEGLSETGHTRRAPDITIDLKRQYRQIVEITTDSAKIVLQIDGKLTGIEQTEKIVVPK